MQRHAAYWSAWAKSDAGGSPHSLAGHLLDTFAVGELLWERYIPRRLVEALDVSSSGRGRDAFGLMCLWHDIGKLTPAFQRKCPDLSQLLLAASPDLTDVRPGRLDSRWHHSLAGAAVVSGLLDVEGLSGLKWLVPLIAAHHGRFGDASAYARRPQKGHGDGSWRLGQTSLAHWLVEAVGIELSSLSGATPPSAAVQLQTAGFLVMADWVASSDHFRGTGAAPCGVEEARVRAAAAWDALGLRAGWRFGPKVTAASFEQRFDGQTARPSQVMMLEALEESEQPRSRQGGLADRPRVRPGGGSSLNALPKGRPPGLLILEAPMGEGKTEAGLAAVERLAAIHGCDGWVWAMPTQGTADAAYHRIVRWSRLVDPTFPVALAHGKAMFNKAWRSALEAVRGIHDVFDDDPYGLEAQQTLPRHGVPAEWLLGRHRPLLCPGVVCTVDQLLYAATTTSFVQLRHAGLAGKVVVIDEVHSYDVYMSRFVHRLLAWCGQAGQPVVLMSATLPPRVRAELLGAYEEGRDGAGGLDGSNARDRSLPAARAGGQPCDEGGYPRLTVAPTIAESPREVRTCPAWRDDTTVEVRLAHHDPDDLPALADHIRTEAAGGGCVLVVLNTVHRAQEVYRLLRERVAEVVLLHSRLTVDARARRTAHVVDALGARPSGPAGRPRQMIVVSTQVAEQSFDADADLLFTDLAPMDLLLQRIGRLHRHPRAPQERPEGMRTPRVVVTGVRLHEGAVPTFARGFTSVYDEDALWASAAALLPGTVEWQMPSAIPRLVSDAYRVPFAWPAGWEAGGGAAADKRRSEQDLRSGRADTFALKSPRECESDLAGLTAHSLDEGAVLVRDGEPSREVVLVVRTDDGYRALDGTPIGLHGEACTRPDVARRVLGHAVRVRCSDDLGDLRPLDGWADTPLLHRADALVLEESSSTGPSGAPRARVPAGVVEYDDELGLLIHRGRR